MIKKVKFISFNDNFYVVDGKVLQRPSKYPLYQNAIKKLVITLHITGKSSTKYRLQCLNTRCGKSKMFSYNMSDR